MTRACSHSAIRRLVAKPRSREIGYYNNRIAAKFVNISIDCYIPICGTVHQFGYCIVCNILLLQTITCCQLDTPISQTAM